MDPEHLVMLCVLIAALAMCLTAGSHVACPMLCVICSVSVRSMWSIKIFSVLCASRVGRPR